MASRVVCYLRAPRYEEAVARLRGEYDVMGHLQPGANPNATLSDRLGLTDYLLDRFAFAGTPQDCRDKLARLQSVPIDGFIFSVSASPDLEGTSGCWPRPCP